MTPIKFTIKNGVTHFHYKASELICFVREGKKYGNVGLILTKRNGSMFTYRGFGTNENPFTYMATFSIVHSPFFGKMPTDEEVLTPSNLSFNTNTTSFSYVMLDCSKVD